MANNNFAARSTFRRRVNDKLRQVKRNSQNLADEITKQVAEQVGAEQRLNYMVEESKDADAELNLDAKTTTPSGERSGGIKAVLITAGFTFLGTLVGIVGKGFFDQRLEHEKSVQEIQLENQRALAQQQLERQRFDSELVKTAISANDPDTRLHFLEFMVKTHLILDADIRNGVEGYIQEVQGDPKKSVPQYVPLSGSRTAEIDGVLPTQVDQVVQDFVDRGATNVTKNRQADGNYSIIGYFNSGVSKGTEGPAGVPQTGKSPVQAPVVQPTSRVTPGSVAPAPSRPER
jgi:hypothetical protein